jgi:hypothetical protein
MKITKPMPNATFLITAAPAWPDIHFETDASGPHTWQWTIVWDAYQLSGSGTTPDNRWNAKSVIVNCGGTLTVQAQAGQEKASATVVVKGTQPTEAEVMQYLATKENGAGFGSIIRHETKCKHFNASNEPIKSFDKGFGLTQLTTPAPSFQQVWNWKLNIDAALALFDEKARIARTYLSQSNRAFTPEQLKYETVCRWNGGAYHVWDAAGGKWVRTSRVLCDTKTHNIGWDMTDLANKDKTEAVLHARDSASYRSKPGPDAHWKYFGVCYADRVLD